MLELAGDRAGVGEVAEEPSPLEGERGQCDQCGGPDHHNHGAEEGVDALVIDPAGRDPLVDDVRLLEEQLPRRDGGADDRDQEQDRSRARAAADAGNQQVVDHVADPRMDQHEQRDYQQVREHEQEHRPFP